MSAGVCVLLYGVALVWLCPPVLTRLTRNGLSPRLSVTVWLCAIGLALAAWTAAGTDLLLHVVGGETGAAPVRYCMHMLLAISHSGWVGDLVLLVVAIAALILSVIVLYRMAVALRRRWARSHEHAQAARVLGRPARRPGVVILQADEPAAYCVAGPPHTIVVTSAALATLNDSELAAVLAHERAHISSRHPQLIMFLQALADAMPRLPLFPAAVRAVGRLVEMCADDAAARRHGRHTLLDGLFALAGHRGTAKNSLGAADTAVLARVMRLSSPAGRAARLRQHIALTATLSVMLAAPIVITSLCHH